MPYPDQSARQPSRAWEADVVAAQKGDTAALSRLWEQNRRWVAAVVLAHKPAFEELEDLLQEVAMAMVKRLDSLRDPASLRPWLRTVAVNAARASARRGRTRRDAESTLRSEHAVTFANGTDPCELDHVRRTLRRVAQLPETYREPLLLRAMHGLRSRQIADIVGVEPATIDTRIARARRMVREFAEGSQSPPSLLERT